MVCTPKQIWRSNGQQTLLPKGKPYIPPIRSLQTFLRTILSKEPEKISPAIQRLKTLNESNLVLAYSTQKDCQQNATILAASQSTQEASIPRVKDRDTLPHTFNHILDQAPQFIDNDLAGLPFSALLVSAEVRCEHLRHEYRLSNWAVVLQV